jgi:hypothetical protein
MKKSLLFMGIVITSLVMLFTYSEAKSFSSQYPVLKKELRRSVMLVSFESDPRLPLNNSGDKNTTHFQATPSFSNQTATYIIRLNQQVFCSFKTLFKRQNIEKYRLVKPSIFHSFLFTLLRVIASPNAP